MVQAYFPYTGKDKYISYLLLLFITLSNILKSWLNNMPPIQLATAFEQVYFHRKKIWKEHKKKRNICVLYDFAKL